MNHRETEVEGWLAARGWPPPENIELTEQMLQEGVRVLRGFYRQPFIWLAEYHVREIFDAMIAAKFPRLNLAQVIEIHRRFLRQGQLGKSVDQ